MCQRIARKILTIALTAISCGRATTGDRQGDASSPDLFVDGAQRGDSRDTPGFVVDPSVPPADPALVAALAMRSPTDEISIVLSEANVKAAVSVSDKGLYPSTAAGPCSLERHYSEEVRSNLAVNAGQISVQMDSKEIASVLQPKMNWPYDTAGYVMFLPWSGGETITVVASGGLIPAFSTSTVTPGTSLVTITAPAVADVPVDSTKDLTFEWTGGTAGTVQILLRENAATPVSIVLRCTYPATAGRGTVPAGVLKVLPSATVGILWFISGGVDLPHMVRAGAYSVVVQTSGPKIQTVVQTFHLTN